MIKIMIDSTTDLPKELIEEFHIGLIPLQVLIDDVTYLDKVTISVDELYHYLRQDNYAKTSQPNPAIVEDLVSEQAELGHDIIVIAISSKLSGTFQTIHMVTEQLKEKYPNNKITVIDSQGGSGVPAIMALQAAKLHLKGHTYEEIIQVMHELSLSCEHVFSIENLKHLLKSGRLNKTEAFIGSVLNIKPILNVVDGEIKVYSKVRGMKKALHAMVDVVEERIKNFPKQIIGIMHADDLETANQLKDMITERVGNVKVIMDKIGSAIGTHIGIGGVGVFFFNQKPSLYIYD